MKELHEAENVLGVEGEGLARILDVEEDCEKKSLAKKFHKKMLKMVDTLPSGMKIGLSWVCYQICWVTELSLIWVFIDVLRWRKYCRARGGKNHRSCLLNELERELDTLRLKLSNQSHHEEDTELWKR